MAAERIRIVHCTGSLWIGGAEHQLTERIRRLPADRFEQSLVLIRREGPFLERVLATDCDVIGLRRSPTVSTRRYRRLYQRPLAIARFVRFLRRKRPHILHAQLRRANTMALISGRLAAVPVVVTSQLNLCRDPLATTRAQRIENRVNRAATRVLANSRAIVSELVEYEGVDPERIRMISNGVDLDRFSPRTVEQQDRDREAAGFAHQDRVIAYVANLHPYKGHEDLVRAFARLDPEGSNLRLVLIGRDAGAESHARDLAWRLGVSDSVRFMGRVDAVEDLLSFAEMVVHPSHEEGFANAILEAMSVGKPVVATNVGGNGEAIVDGRTGLLVPAHDPVSLAAAMNRLLVDGDLSRAMGRAARARAESRYGMDHMVDAYASWYVELAAGAGRS